MITIPNLLTSIRAAGIPVFLWLVLFVENQNWAVVTLMIAGATDYFDGKLARALNQESRFGELMDPAVDRLYIIAVLIAMFATEVIPLWVLAPIVLRDVILGVILILLKRKGFGPWKVTYLGKAATFNLLYALPLLLLTESNNSTVSNWAFVFGWSFAGWGIALYLWTGIGYARAGFQLLKK